VLIGAVSLLLSARLTARFGGRTALVQGWSRSRPGSALLGRAPVDGSYAWT